MEERWNINHLSLTSSLNKQTEENIKLYILYIFEYFFPIPTPKYSPEKDRSQAGPGSGRGGGACQPAGDRTRPGRSAARAARVRGQPPARYELRHARGTKTREEGALFVCVWKFVEISGEFFDFL